MAQSVLRRAARRGGGPPKGREFEGRGLRPSPLVGTRPRPGLSCYFRRCGTEEHPRNLREPSVVRWGLKGRREVPGLTV